MTLLVATITESRLGLQAILDIEKIPYVYCEEPVDFKSTTECILVTEASLVNGPCIFFGEPSSVLLELFGAKDFDVINCNLCTISTTDKIRIPALDKFGFSKVSVPVAKLVVLDPDLPDVNVLAVGTIDNRQNQVFPVIVSKGNNVWCLFDLGLAFYNLLTEDYWETGTVQKKSLLAYSVFRKLYYEFLPASFRKWTQRRHFFGLEKSLRDVDSFKTMYPVDASGFFIIQLFRELLLKVSGVVVSLSKWPYPYMSAAVLTHDVEPTSFSYKQGLKKLLDVLGELNVKPIINLVADSAKRRVCSDFFDPYLYCFGSHGLYHDAKLHLLDYDELKNRLVRSREVIGSVTKRNVDGFRAPRLQRTRKLIRVVDEAGFLYDFSFIDVDREGTARYGAGVSVNFPFHPFFIDGANVCVADFLELPTSAPDCVAPVFMGYTEDECVKMFERKIDWVYDTEGVFVGNVHAGVFDEKDAELRTRLLLCLVRYLRDKKNMWFVGADDVYCWWIAREKICLSFDGDERAVRVFNCSTCGVDNVVLNVSTVNECKTFRFSLGASEEILVKY